MKNIIIKIVILALATLVSCKVDVDTTSDINTVEFSIKTEDVDDSLAYGAKVFIYSSEDDYTSGYVSNDTSGSKALFKGVATKGTFLQDLDSKKSYWIRIIYSKKSKSSLLSGNEIYSNDEEGVKFGPFESNSFDGTKMITKATITLTKAYSFLIVAAKDNSSINVKVFHSGKECALLNSNQFLFKSGFANLSDIPDSINLLDITTTRYLIFVVPKGKIKIYSNNSLGCISTVETVIYGGGTIEKYLLDPCISGRIMFYNKGSRLTDIEISFTNPNEYIATLSGKIDRTPQCGEVSTNKSFVSIYRPLGEYPYVASSKSGNCEYKGTVIIKNIGECIPEEIKMCQ